METAGRDKKEAFDRLSVARLKDLARAAKLTGNLGNQYNYTFTKEGINHIIVEAREIFATMEKRLLESFAEPNGEKKKGRPRRNRIPESEATTTANIAKEMGEEAKQELIAGPILTTKEHRHADVEMPSDDDIPDFLKKDFQKKKAV
jgi:hypothetical protein